MTTGKDKISIIAILVFPLYLVNFWFWVHQNYFLVFFLGKLDSRETRRARDMKNWSILVEIGRKGGPRRFGDTPSYRLFLYTL